jgi:two-component system response regulator NreC
MKIRVLVADDHTIVRKGVRMLIGSQPDMEVVGEAATGREAVDEARRLTPDVVIMDISMPELTGIESARQICAELEQTRVVVLTMHRDSAYVREVLRAGALGYLLKDSEHDDLLRAIRSVHRGEAFLSPAISADVLNDYRRHVTRPVDMLTAREREILILIAEGKANKEIAQSLKLSVYTVETHRASIMDKLDLHNTGDIVRFAIRNGLIS